MVTKIAGPLLQQIEEAKKTDPLQEFSVIVTVTPDADLTVLEQKGLKIQLRLENLPGASGTLTAAKAEEIAALDQVKLIEPEGEVHALQ
jgi:hypothetical protein